MAENKKKKTTKKTTKKNSNSLKKKNEELQKKLDSLAEENEKLIEKNIRLLAEFDNYKRRTQKERVDLIEYSGFDLAKSMLPIIDDLLRTLDINNKTKTQTIIDGIKLISSKFDKTLEEHGIVAFDSIGEDFDPALHEALMNEKSNEDENIIIKEFERGYKYNDRILRHAKVVVSKK